MRSPLTSSVPPGRIRSTACCATAAASQRCSSKSRRNPLVPSVARRPCHPPWSPRSTSAKPMQAARSAAGPRRPTRARGRGRSAGRIRAGRSGRRGPSHRRRPNRRSLSRLMPTELILLGTAGCGAARGRPRRLRVARQGTVPGYMSTTMSERGREQQMSTWPSDGASSGSLAIVGISLNGPAFALPAPPATRADRRGRRSTGSHGRRGHLRTP